MRKLWKLVIRGYNSHGGLYIITEEEIDLICGMETWFSELDGKYGDVQWEFEKSDFELLSTDPVLIEKMTPFIGYCSDCDPWGLLCDLDEIDFDGTHYVAKER